jgi:hypothetical protein
MKRAAIVLAAVLAVAGLPAAAEAGKRTIVVRATSQIERAHLVDNAPTGRSAGDMLIFTEKLFDLQGRRIGDDAATCVSLFDETWLCTGTYRLPGGRLMVQLHQPGPGVVYEQAITGGTGRYAGARGTVTVDQRPDGDRFTFRIRSASPSAKCRTCRAPGSRSGRARP